MSPQALQPCHPYACLSLLYAPLLYLEEEGEATLSSVATSRCELIAHVEREYTWGVSQLRMSRENIPGVLTGA
eukprot:3914590-Pyramimonas_sp.AAC.1